MNLNEAEQVYFYQVERTKALLNSMGNNPQAINAFITNTYAALSQNDPAFLWFSLGTVVSNKVGQNLQFSAQTSIHLANQAPFANVILNNFSEGNQAIFKNIVTLFLTYESIGMDGIELLRDSSFENPFNND